MKFNYFIQNNNEENYIFYGHILNNIVNKLQNEKEKANFNLLYFINFFRKKFNKNIQ